MNGRSEKNLFGNILVVSPNEKPMFRASKRRVDWYLERNLGKMEFINNENILKLSFEPHGLGVYSDPDLLELVENKCVVCLSEQNLCHAYVIPYQYRKLFPTEFKDHRFYDLITLCVSCQEKYFKYTQILVKELAEKYSAPLDASEFFKKGMRRIQYLAKLAKLMLNPEIPEKYLIEKKQILKDLLGREEISAEDLNFLIERDRQNKKQRSMIQKNHAVIVVQSLLKDKSNNELVKFINIWKCFFVQKMQPKYIPAYFKLEIIRNLISTSSESSTLGAES